VGDGCSGELRERVIEAVEIGASRREAAELFEVSVSSATKLLQRWRDSGSAAAKSRGGSISPLEKFATQIRAVIAEHPDPTLVETVALLRKHRIRASRSSLWRFLNRRKITSKNTQAEERQCADVARARRRWIREQGARLRGRAPRGIRAIVHVPVGTWKTITFVAALRHNKIVAPMVVEGAMNGEMFLIYVQECLAPTLRRRDIRA
jgi:transposase